MTLIESAAGLAGAILNSAGCCVFLQGRIRPADDVNGILGALWAPGFSLWAAAALMAGVWWLAAFYGVFAALAAWGWWDDRRKRRRKHAARSLGYKARARIASLARKAREAARPRRVLRPVPGGARCT